MQETKFLFKSIEEYYKFRDDFIESLKPANEELSKKRYKSEIALQDRIYY